MTDAKPRAPRRPAPPAAGGAELPSKIEHWPLERVKPYAKNPRLHAPEQVRRLAFSILEYGFTSPLLVERNGNLIAGHGRLAAARKLGLERVPVIILDHLTEVQRRAYLIADNKLALDAEWDSQLLVGELKALEAEAFDLAAAGFSAAELEALEHELARAEAAPAARRGRPAGQIIAMIEFDTVAQRDRWKEFVQHLRQRAPGKSAAAALIAHVDAVMSAQAKPARG